MMHSDLVAHAPVVIFQITLCSDRLIGYATPKAGLRPSVVNLVAGGEVICAAKASRYSAEAAVAGIRHGWCGFELAGLSRALAISADCFVLCAATGGVLERIDLTPNVFAARSPRSQALTAAEVLDLAAGERCKDITSILPFAIDHRNRHGVNSFLEASWQMVMDRLPDAEAIDLWRGVVETDVGVQDFLEIMVNDAAGATSASRRLPGPFHPSFRYDRTLLG